MNTNPLHYQNTLKYFQFNKTFDLQTGKYRVPEWLIGSNGERLARTLTAIESDSPQQGYLNNRLRETIACLIFSGIMSSAVPTLSTARVDLFFRVDATVPMKIHWITQQYAINFTESYSTIPSKLQSTDIDGNIIIWKTEWLSIKLPFLVVMISSVMVDMILQSAEDIIVHNPWIQLYHLRNILRIQIRQSIQKDVLPEHLFNIHTKLTNEQLASISNRYIAKMLKYKNPSPSR
jgi:hypothetical protein